MKLVIGGCAQGKLQYVLHKYHLGEEAVWDGCLPEDDQDQDAQIYAECPVVIDHLHQWIRCALAEQRCPEKEILSFLDRCEECIIISDEIGNGIVPADAFEREYRERAGRILVLLAKRAEEVERVLCGIGQRIK